MKKIIALAVVAVAVTACDFDLREDEASASVVKLALVTGRSAEAAGGPWFGTATTGNDYATFVNGDGESPTPSAATLGRVLVLTTDGLLDGSSIELNDPTTCVANANCCVPATGSLTVTSVPAGHPTTGGQWYTCYYPSSATTDDGASVFVFWATVPPGTATASQPIRSGVMVAGDYSLSGTFKGKGGNTINWSADITVQ